MAPTARKASRMAAVMTRRSVLIARLGDTLARVRAGSAEQALGVPTLLLAISLQRCPGLRRRRNLYRRLYVQVTLTRPSQMRGTPAGSVLTLGASVPRALEHNAAARSWVPRGRGPRAYSPGRPAPFAKRARPARAARNAA